MLGLKRVDEMSMITRENAPKWLHLSREENVLWSGRPHWITIILPIAVAILMCVIGLGGTAFLIQNDISAVTEAGIPGWVSFIPLILTVIGVAGGVWVYIRWRFTVYVITSREVYEKRGVISQNTDHFRIKRIQNTTCNQSIMERLLSFGNVVIYTAGSGKQDMILDHVPNPKQVDRTLAVQYDKIQKKDKQENQTAEQI